MGSLCSGNHYGCTGHCLPWRRWFPMQCACDDAEQFYTPIDSNFSPDEMVPHMHVERSRWLNMYLESLWPHISVYLERSLRESLEPLLQQATGFSGLHFREIDFGSVPVSVQNIHIGTYVRTTAKKKVKGLALRMDVAFCGDARATVSYGGAMVGFSMKRVAGGLIVHMPELTDVAPFILGYTVYFPNIPELELEWHGLTSVLEAQPLQKLRHSVEHIMRQQIAALYVLPNQYGVPYDDAEDLFHYKRLIPEGLLDITVVEARGLKDGAHRSWLLQPETSPYVTISLGADEFRTITKPKTVNPRWDLQRHAFEVTYAQEQDVIVHVHDKARDNLLGYISVPVHTMKDKPDSWFDLSETDGSCDKSGAQIRLQACWRGLHLDPDQAKSIPLHCEAVTCALYVAIYCASGIPGVPVGSSQSFWLDLCVEDEGAIQKQSTWKVPYEEPTAAPCQANLERTIASLSSDGVSHDIIARAVGCPLEMVQQYLMLSPRTRTGHHFREIKIKFEEAFVFFMRSPHTATLHFEVRTDGDAGWGFKEKGGSRCVGEGADYQVSQLLQHPRNTEKLDLKLRVWDASVIAKVQLRVLDPHQPKDIRKRLSSLWSRSDSAIWSRS